MAIIPRNMTDAMNDRIVKNPSAEQAASPKTQRCLIIVTIVTGMLTIETNRSAAARFKMYMLVMVQSFLSLKTMMNKLTLPTKAAKQIKQSTVVSKIVAKRVCPISQA